MVLKIFFRAPSAVHFCLFKREVYTTMPDKRKPGRPRTVTVICPIQGRVSRPPVDNVAQYVCLQNPRKLQYICTTFKLFGAPEVYILFYSDVLVFAGSASRKPHSKCAPTSLCR